MVDAWAIEWFICRMDPSDVKHARSTGKADAKVGDELWRVPLAIGPIGTDHNHWSGTCLSGEPEDWRLAAAAPVLLELLKEARNIYVEDCFGRLDQAFKKRIDDTIRQIEQGGGRLNAQHHSTPGVAQDRQGLDRAGPKG